MSPTWLHKAFPAQGVRMPSRSSLHPVPTSRHLAFSSHEEGLQESQLLELWWLAFLDPLSFANINVATPCMLAIFLSNGL